MSKKPVLLLVALATARITFAAGAPAEPFFDELPVVLSASRLVQPIADAPAAVTVIDR